jgi:hypothetical protein
MRLAMVAIVLLISFCFGAGIMHVAALHKRVRSGVVRDITATKLAGAEMHVEEGGGEIDAFGAGPAVFHELEVEVEEDDDDGYDVDSQGNSNDLIADDWEDAVADDD